jgi:chorismate mutase
MTDQPTDNLRLQALRGAISVEENDAGLILERTEELLRALLDRNGLEHDRLVSVIFTCTSDLNAEFPAVAARRIGLNTVPLLCTQELDVPGAMPGVIRVLAHCYADDGRPAQHVYLREAQSLRADLGSPQ